MLRFTNKLLSKDITFAKYKQMWCLFVYFFHFVYAANGQLGDRNDDQVYDVLTPQYDPARLGLQLGEEFFELDDSFVNTTFKSYINNTITSSEKDNDYFTQFEAILSSARKANPVLSKLKTIEKLALNPLDANSLKTIESNVQGVFAAQKNITEGISDVEELNKKLATIRRRISIEEKKREFNFKKIDGKKVFPPPTIKHKEYLNQEREHLKRIKNLDKFGDKGLLRAKNTFAATLAQLYLQRKFEHVEIGSQLFDDFFKNEKNVIRLSEKSTSKKRFSHLKADEFTVERLGLMAREMNAKIRHYVQLSNEHYLKGEFLLASNRMLDAFSLGENTNYIKALPLETKMRFREFMKLSSNYNHAVQMRDFEKAQSLAKSLSSKSNHYPLSEVTAHNEAFINASNHHLDLAVAALNIKDQATAIKQTNDAKVLWPENPRIAIISEMFSSGVTTTINNSLNYQKAVASFNHLRRAEDYHELLKPEVFQQFEMQFKAANDNRSLTQLQEFKATWSPLLQTIEKLLADSHNEPVLAWEDALSLQNDHSEDKEVAKLLATIEQRAQPVPALLGQAGTLINKKEFGSALSRVLKVQQIHPQCKLAQKQLEIILKQVD